MSIYTKTGDGGLTTLMKSKNISKADDRIELLGTIDELTSHLGLLRAEGKYDEFAAIFLAVQKNLMTVMAGIADPFNKTYRLADSCIQELEAEIDRLEALFPRKKEFIIPGSCEASARVDIARTIARRAERCLVSVDRKFGSDSAARKYLNRLADYLYITARYIDYLYECKEEPDTAEGAPVMKNGEVKMDQEGLIQAVMNKIGKIDRISLDVAKRLIDKIEEYCKSTGFNSVIAVCGADGNMIAVHVMEDSFLASFDIAMKKAYTSVAVKMSTMELGKMAQPGGTFYGVDKADNGRLVIFGGGIPLEYQGKIIGGLGISGGTGEQDHAVAEYGLKTMLEIYDSLV